MINIQPIKLLSGSHADTGSTGQGCFMNVIAYLNGEPQITDESDCVCVTIRPIAIWLNDYMNDDERQQLIPFIMRAMGTATGNKQVIIDRLTEVVNFSEKAVEYAKSAAQYADGIVKAAKYAKSAAEYAAEYAEYAAEYAAKSTKYVEYAAAYAKYAAKSADESVKYAAKYAKSAAEYAAEYAEYAEFRAGIIASGIQFLDRVCPPLDSCITQEVLCRAEKLVALNTIN